MNFDPLSFILGKRGAGGPIGDLVSYLMGRAVGAAREVWKTITNVAVASFTAVAAPVRALVVDINPAQDLHGYANPWPAGGGKNILDESLLTDGKWLDVDTGKVFDYTGSRKATVDYISCDADTPYYFAAYGSNKVMVTGGYALIICWYASDETFISSQNSGVSNSVITSPSNASFYRIGVVSQNYFACVQKTASPSDTSYSPYSNICPITGWDEAKIWVQPTHDTTANPTVTIDLDGTRYGGTLDVTTGVLTVDRAMVEFDGSPDETWYWNYSGVAFGLVVNGIITDETTQFEIWTICDKLKSTSWTARGDLDYCCGMYFHASYVFIKVSDSISNEKTARTWLSNNPIQVVYELDTPQTYQLTPAEVTTLLGQNNVWADTGNINSLTYRADIELYIAKKLAEA